MLIRRSPILIPSPLCSHSFPSLRAGRALLSETPCSSVFGARYPLPHFPSPQRGAPAIPNGFIEFLFSHFYSAACLRPHGQSHLLAGKGPTLRSLVAAGARGKAGKSSPKMAIKDLITSQCRGRKAVLSQLCLASMHQPDSVDHGSVASQAH